MQISREKDQSMKKLSYVFGIIIPLWLGLGVFATGLLYPGYSHVNQAMSELGASGAPTHFISPIINNFPLGILFIVFGIAVIKRFPAHPLSKISGALIFVHGLGSIAAGYFSCDAGCRPESPSISQILHSIAGMVMLLTLLLANGLWIYLGKKLLHNTWFSIFSLLCTLLAISVIPLLGPAIESGRNFGLYQRINYGVSVIWVAGLAYVLFLRISSVAAIQEKSKDQAASSHNDSKLWYEPPQ